MQQILDKILSLDITDVLQKYISLKKKGANHIASCPFHSEKTASFMVSNSKGIYKCFGCGKGGNAINFVMNFNSMSFIDAVKEICTDHKIEFKHCELSPDEIATNNKREQLFIVNEIAAKYFQEQLPNNEDALKYATGRWQSEQIEMWKIGWATSDWQGLYNHAKSLGIKEEILIEAGLIAEKNNRIHDRFHERLMFPISNKYGRIIGFTGRSLVESKENPKYFNTPDTLLYNKSQALYGIQFAHRAIKEQKCAIIMEGNPDVIRMHHIDKTNSVATCGTSLTTQHIDEIKALCSSVVIIGDTDNAGKKAVEKSAEKFIRAGLYANVLTIPDDGEKQDPDTFFTSRDQYDDFAKENIQDYIILLAKNKKEKAKNPDFLSKLINDIAELISYMPINSHGIYIEQISKILGNKKLLQDQLNEKLDDGSDKKDDAFKIPDKVSLSDWEKYGFYDDNNCYYFKGQSGIIKGSNFTIEPLFHIASVLDAKRLFKIKNEFGFEQIIEIPQKDLISPANFKLRVESLGNFLFEGGEKELNKLKRYLYEKTESCFEITQLGWQKDGFWSWGNGLFNGKEFINVNEYGIAKMDDKNYYLPAQSKIYEEEKSLFTFERKFIHTAQNNISFDKLVDKFVEVYGEKCISAICFYIATVFRDIIVAQTRFFPLLFLFGPKGAGKTELAVSLLQFFGHLPQGPNMLNSTKAGLSDHIAQTSNACCHLDEYKNTLELEKIEFLKGLWDGTGRTRMNMDKDKKKETTSVDCGVVVSGQEMPTLDVAFFTRTNFIPFYQVEFSDEERKRYDEFKTFEKQSFTHITNNLLQYRDYFKENFFKNYNSASEEIKKELGDNKIEDRIFRNWLIPVAAFKTLQGKLSINFEYSRLTKITVDFIIKQNAEIKKSNEVAIFWAMMEYFVSDKQLLNEVDFRIEFETKIDLEDKKCDFNEPKKVLFLNHTRVFQLYRLHGKKASDSILPVKTMEYYLKTSPEYIGKKRSMAFKVFEGAENERKITSAMAFEYLKLGISLETRENYSEETPSQKSETDNIIQPKQGDLPF